VFFFSFLEGDLVITPAIGVLGYSSVLLSLLFNSYVGIIELIASNNILFVAFCSGSGITSGNSNCIISASIGLIGRYLDVMLCVVVGSAVSS
jgi:hypothetical protein